MIQHFSTWDYAGGAARAAYRIHRALVDCGHDSRMRVLQKSSQDDRVTAVSTSLPVVGRLAQRVRRRIAARRRRDWHTDNANFHSFGDEGAPGVARLGLAPADVIHLHWICGLVSIADVGRMRGPVVWTLHDMWPFCGAEHYAPDGADARFRQGYLPANRPAAERGPDVNRSVWLRKRNAWARQRFAIVSPSSWLARCAAESALFSRCPIHVVPYPLDVHGVWRPTPKAVARAALRLPAEPRLILFVATGGTEDHRKGADLLRQSLSALAVSASPPAELLIVGQEKPAKDFPWPMQAHWLGSLRDDRLLALANSAADVVVVPSRQDNLPNTAQEAQACGTPVVAFRVGGLPDLVTHQRSGWLAEPFDVRDFARGIEWVISDPARHAALADAARDDTVVRNNPATVADQYSKIYSEMRQTAS